jgi:Fe-S cluster assembly protein SufD
MSSIPRNGAQAFLARYEGLKDRLPGDAAIRAAAAASFEKSGLPGVRDEAWKYTSLRPVADAGFHEPLTLLEDCADLLALAPSLDAPRLVFCGGRFRADLSTENPSVQVGRFADTAVFGAQARPDREPLVALNTMLAQDGAILDVAAGVDAGALVLLSLAEEVHGLPIACHPRHTVRLAAGATLTLIEISTGRGTYLHNPVFEIAVAAGASLTHVRLQDEAPGAFHLATIYADIAAGGTYDSFTFNVGARLVRTEVHAALNGAGGVAHLNAAQLLRGVQHGDFTSVVSHQAPSCISRQTVKNVLADKSRGVFQGRIEVARGAQKTDGYQMNQALLLSPEAEVDSKPELEIYADDVKCSHGATVGELDPEQFFYLRSRGIPADEARAMLVRAFLIEALDAVANPAARGALEQVVEQWWQREAA